MNHTTQSFFLSIFFCIGLVEVATAQTNLTADVRDIQQINADGTVVTKKQMQAQADSLGTDKEIPKGLKVWTVDARFGDIIPAEPDTLSPNFQNTIFTTGLYGQYNTTGNLGAPRQNRIFIDRQEDNEFFFVNPYDYVVPNPETFHFTNTLSPFTNLTFNTAGNREQGEDHIAAKFGVNIGKKIGVGFNYDYLYGRGYYANQNTSHAKYQLYGSYIGEQYQAHLLFSTLHQKVTENGGITDDNYITHPERFETQFETDEIPTVLNKNWNRNDNQHIFFTHRYSVGFRRKVKMTDDEIKARQFALESKKDNDAQRAKEEAERKARKAGQDFDEDDYQQQPSFAGRPKDARIMGAEPETAAKNDSTRIKVTADQLPSAPELVENAAEPSDTAWMKTEYVPVTSFIHTVQFNNYRRIYEAYEVPDNYFLNIYDVAEKLQPDSIYDQTKHFRLKNTFAISLLEGFNKWAKAGLKVFAEHEMRHYTLPSAIGKSSFNENGVFVGGQLSKRQGHWLHYDVTASAGVAGDDVGEFSIDANADFNFPLMGDTAQIAATAFFHRTGHEFYYQHYQSRHFWWEQDDLDEQIHSHLEAMLTLPKTKTQLRVAFDQMKNYCYFARTYSLDDDLNHIGTDVTPMQCGDNITVLTAQLLQNFKLGPVHWDNILTYQKSSKEDVLPLPKLNIYTNLYLRFKIAKVLKCDLGADMRYFTRYYAPDYSPELGQFAVQATNEKVETGSCPIVNVYANFHLKHTRFFVMFSHVNEGMGSSNYFFTPHYPLNGRILRFGLSWNFFN